MNGNCADAGEDDYDPDSSDGGEGAVEDRGDHGDEPRCP